MIFSVYHRETLTMRLLKMAAKYQRLPELSGRGLICVPMVTAEVSSPSCLHDGSSLWEISPRPPKSTVQLEVVFTLLRRPRLLASSSDISFCASHCATWTKAGLPSSSCCFPSESRNTHSVESHWFNTSKMSLLKLQSGGLQSLGVLSLTIYSTVILQYEGDKVSVRTLQLHWSDLSLSHTHTHTHTHTLIILFYTKGQVQTSLGNEGFVHDTEQYEQLFHWDVGEWDTGPFFKKTFCKVI